MLLHLIDVAEFLLLILGPLPIAALLAITTGNGKSDRELSPVFIALIIYWCGFNISIGILLGAVGVLSAGNVFLAEAILLGAGLFPLLKNEKLRESLNNVVQRTRSTLSGLSSLEVIILLIILVLALDLTWTLLTRPVTNYDSLAYHMPAMANWYQSATLQMPRQHLVPGYYPHGWEVLSTLFLFPFGEDFMATFPNLMAWGLFGLVVYALCRYFQAERIYALSASAMALSFPIILERLNSLEIDLPFAGVFLSSLLFMLSWSRTRNTLHLPLLFTSVALLLGIKMSAFTYALLLLAVFLVLLPARSPKKAVEDTKVNKIKLGRLWLYLLPVLLITGCFWYLRNFLETGNPFGFLKISLAGYNIFEGPVSLESIGKTTLLAIFNPLSGHDWAVLLNRINGHLGLPFFTMLILTVWLPFSLLEKNKKHGVYKVVPLFLLLAALLLLHLTTPFSGDNGTNNYKVTIFIGQAFRYALPLLGVLAVASSLTMSQIRIKPEFIAVLTILGCCAGIAGTKVLLYVVVIMLVIIPIVRFLFNSAARRPARSVTRISMHSLTVLLLLSLLVIGTYGARDKRDEMRGEVCGGLIAAVEQNSSKHDTIGYAFSDKSYYLYGKHFDRRVEYLHLGSIDPCDWAEEIRMKGSTLLAVGPLPMDSMASHPVLRWLLSGSNGYDRIFGKNVREETILLRITAGNPQTTESVQID